MKRIIEFKMERTGLVQVGEVLPVTESRLPTSWYYTLGRSFAMSGNFDADERITATEGKVVDIRETPRGFYVDVEVED